MREPLKKGEISVVGYPPFTGNLPLVFKSNVSET